MAQVWLGRFGYSDLKGAAFSGAAALWELMEFSWSDGLVARPCGTVEQAECRPRLCLICFGCCLDERA